MHDIHIDETPMENVTTRLESAVDTLCVSAYGQMTFM